MAGIDDDIENEGAIDTGDNSQQNSTDNSGAAPVAVGAIDTGDNSGAAPVVGAQPADPHPGYTSAIGGLQTSNDQTPGWTPGGAANGAKSGMKAIVSYLMGADAAPPQALDQAGQQVDPQGQMPPGDRNLIAIDKAAETGGQDAAWKLLQANRVAFNAKQAFARTAMRGVQGKPADINAAIDAANQAEQHIPDGSNVRFSRSQNGVTATVTMPGTSQPQQIQLTPEQFDKWLDVGGEGQWDKAHQASVPATLQRISQSGGQRLNPAMLVTGSGGSQTGMATIGQPGQPAPKQAAAPTPSRAVSSGQPQARDVTQADQPAIPGGGKPQGNPQVAQTAYGAELEARAHRMFPGFQAEHQRNEWMAAQEEKELTRQSAVNVAAEKGKWADKRADTSGKYHVQAADVTGQHKENGWRYSTDQKAAQAAAKLDMAIRQEQARNGRSALAEAAKNVRAKMANPGIPITDQDQELLKKLGIAADQAISGHQQAPAQPPAQGAEGDIAPAPPDATKRVAGQKYRSTTGKVGVWTGQGWQVVQ